MTTLEISRLGDDAINALQRGELKTALQLYLRLEQADSRNAAWPRGTALVFRKFGQKKQEIEALGRAAGIYVDLGDVLKATTVLKQILALDPNHADAARWLEHLHARLRQGRRTQVPTQPPPPAWSSSAPNAPIDQVKLRDVVPGASQELPGVFLIPLGGDDDVSESTADLPRFRTQPPPSRLRPEAPVEDVAVLAVEKEVRAAETLKKVLPATPLFASIRRQDSFGALITHAKLLEFPKDAEVFHQGSKGDALFIVAEGTFGVIDEGPPRKGIAKLDDGDIFGEIALITDQPRMASVVALSDSTVISIDRHVVNKLIENDRELLTVLLDFLKNRLAERLLLVNPLFSNLSSNDRVRIKKLFRFLEADPGAKLMTEGQTATGLLMILSGTAEVIRGSGATEVRIGKLSSGDLAGEMSLLTDSAAIATVRAKTKCFAIELPAAAFIKIVRGRPEAMAYIREVIEKRKAQADAVLGGQGSFEEGGVSFV